MTKQEFLAALREGLQGLPPADIEERAAFYDEMIDDRMEEGLSEEEAIAQLGTVEEVIAQIAAETPLLRLVKEKVRSERKRSGKGLSTVLLILGSPVWGSLLIAAFAVAFSLYISVWAVVVSLFAAAAGLALGGVAAIPAAVVLYGFANPAGMGAVGGGGLVCVGLGILLGICTLLLTRAVLRLTKKSLLGMKNMLIGKEKNG